MVWRGRVFVGPYADGLSGASDDRVWYEVQHLALPDDEPPDA